MENATEQGEFLLEGLRALHGRFPWLIEDVRGVGLMIGVELPSAELAEELQAAAFRRGLLVLEAGASAVRVSPPLVIDRQQCHTALRLLTEAVEELATSYSEVPRAGAQAGAAP